MMEVLGDSWYAAELGLRTLEDEPMPRWVTRHLGHPIVRGIVLWWRGRGYERVALAGGGVTFRVVMLLERVRPRCRPYLILLEFHPLLEPSHGASTGGSRVRRWLRRAFRACVLAPVLRLALERAHTLSSWEVQRNARAFGVAPERFVFIPFPLTATGDELPTFEDRGRRVLASGRTLCDWPLVFAAAEGQAWDLEIVCSGAERPIVERLNISGLARVRSDIPSEAHGELMREIAVYLLPLREAEVSSGHIRVFDATRGGAPLAAAGVRGLVDYVSDGETALLFAPGDPVAARAAVNRLLEDRPLADRLRQAAFARGRQNTRDAYLDRMRDLVHGRSLVRGPGEAAQGPSGYNSRSG